MNNKEISKKKVFVRTFGCQMNTRDSEAICGLLKADGWESAVTPEEADAVIFNTCSVRQHAEDKVWSEIGRIAKIKGHKPVIGVAGCMAQNYKEHIFQRCPAVDFVVGPADIHKIPEIIKRVMKSGGRKAANKSLYEIKVWETEGSSRPEEVYRTGFYEDKEHAFVVISEGCSNFCSYCVVPYTRGNLKHRRHSDILNEIKLALDSGATKVTLLGQNVNAYQDGAVGFVKLLELVNSVKGLKEFGFITSHPKDAGPELFRAMAGCAKLKKYLHMPVQSGSDRILKLMNRGYTAKFYLALADNYRKIVNGAKLTTDVIVGFPTEADEDFRETYELMKDVEFDAAYIFKYSPRPNTAALQLGDDVPKQEKERRHGLILQLQKKISKEKR